VPLPDLDSSDLVASCTPQPQQGAFNTLQEGDEGLPVGFKEGSRQDYSMVEDVAAKDAAGHRQQNADVCQGSEGWRQEGLKKCSIST